jgi:three-Cys-motif partner protein
MDLDMTEHKFGGVWTQVKLDVLRKYLNAYTQALKNQKLNLLYIDAFAGSGECVIKNEDGNITIAGSAQIAISNTPQFSELHFIEKSGKRYKSLEIIKNENNNRIIELYNDDANDVVKKLCATKNWKSSRAVLFLDPYGMSVEWDTLKIIAETKAIDLWYLFPLSGVFRQAALNMNAVDQSKAKSLDLVLGTTEWREKFYSDTGQDDMFSNEATILRTHDVNQIEHFVTERLKCIFPFVAKPLRLPREGAPLYSLFFACSNPAPKAIGLSMKFANSILKGY